MGKLLLLLLLPSLSFICLAQSAAPGAGNVGSGADEQSAITREKALFAADQKHDMATLSDLFADDFVDVAKDGSVTNKQQVMQEIPTLEIKSYSLSDFHFTSLGPQAYAISYMDHVDMVEKGKERNASSELNSVWVLRSGKWQVLLHTRGHQP